MPRGVFRLISGGVHSCLATRIAQTFTFVGETGDGLRGFKRNRPRPAGGLFPGGGDTFLVAISDTPAPEIGDGKGFAFIPGSDLDVFALAEWLGLHDADKSPVCLFNLSEVWRDVRAGLGFCQALVVPVDTGPNSETVDWSKMTSDPLGAFLADCAIRDDKARTPTQDFFRAFAAWYADWTGARLAQADGSRASHAALQEDLLALGIRKVKSSGIMTFAGFHWRDSLLFAPF